MAEYNLNKVFHSLSDETRREVVLGLLDGEKTVSQVAEQFDSALATVSKHLKVLEGAGLISRRIEGRTHYLRLCPEPLHEIGRFVNFHLKNWRSRLS